MALANNTSYPKDKIKILFLENISDAAIKVFKDAGYTDIKKLGGALTEAQLIDEIKNVHLLGIRSKTQVTEKVLKQAAKLQAKNDKELKALAEQERKAGRIERADYIDSIGRQKQHDGFQITHEQGWLLFY